MVFAAMLPWMFFSTSLSTASQSLVGNAQLISKVYFPRMIIPASAVITSFVDFLVSFLILVGMMAWYRFWPDWQILTLPLFMALAFLAAIGPGLWITALNVKYRDFRYVIPFLVQFGLYVSPVGYSSDVIRQRFGDMVFLLYSLNPMVAVIDGFRWAILGGEATIYWPGFLLSLLVSACSWLSESDTFARPRRPSRTSSEHASHHQHRKPWQAIHASPPGQRAPLSPAERGIGQCGQVAFPAAEVRAQMSAIRRQSSDLRSPTSDL